MYAFGVCRARPLSASEPTAASSAEADADVDVGSPTADLLPSSPLLAPPAPVGVAAAVDLRGLPRAPGPPQPPPTWRSLRSLPQPTLPPSLPNVDAGTAVAPAHSHATGDVALAATLKCLLSTARLQSTPLPERVAARANLRAPALSQAGKGPAVAAAGPYAVVPSAAAMRSSVCQTWLRSTRVFSIHVIWNTAL
jgi:hypothetical protein